MPRKYAETYGRAWFTVYRYFQPCCFFAGLKSHAVFVLTNTRLVVSAQSMMYPCIQDKQFKIRHMLQSYVAAALYWSVLLVITNFMQQNWQRHIVGILFSFESPSLVQWQRNLHVYGILHLTHLAWIFFLSGRQHVSLSIYPRCYKWYAWATH